MANRAQVTKIKEKQEQRAAERAILVGLNMRYYTAKKLDKRVTRDACAANGATSDAGRFHKALLARDAVLEYVRHVNETRAWHYAHTLPYDDAGYRLLPTAMRDEYATEMAARQEKFNEIVSNFCVNYDAMREQARDRLGGMFDPLDYPNEAVIRNKFSFSMAYRPLPRGEHLRATDLTEEDVAEMAAAIERDRAAADAEALKGLWERLFTPVAHFVERLDKADGIFRDTLVENLDTALQAVVDLNWCDDPDVEAARARVMEKLTGHAPDTLRDNRKLRADVAAEGMLILKDIGIKLGLDAEAEVRRLRLEKQERADKVAEDRGYKRKVRGAAPAEPVTSSGLSPAPRKVRGKVVEDVTVEVYDPDATTNDTADEADPDAYTQAAVGL